MMGEVTSLKHVDLKKIEISSQTRGGSHFPPLPLPNESGNLNSPTIVT